MNEFADRLPGRLVSGAQSLDREFEERLSDCSTLAFRVAFSVLRHREDAEDVAQDALTKAYRSFRQLRDRERFRAWLVRMTWRMAIDRRRGELRRMARDQTVVVGTTGATVEHDALARERSARLWKAIDQLPEKLRMVIVLASIEEHGLSEVAVLVGAPEGTVKSRLFEARKRLQELLR